MERLERFTKAITSFMGGSGSKLEKALGDSFPEGERYFGLENFGNTCYCNSVLQVLYFCLPFREHLLDHYSRHQPASEAEESLLTCLAELFHQIASQKRRTGVLAPKRFVQRVKKQKELFRSYMHQDAHEFLNFLLNELVDILEKEAKASKEIADGTPEDGSTASLSGPLGGAKEGSPGRGAEARVSGDGGAPSAALLASSTASASASAGAATAAAAASRSGAANGDGVCGTPSEEGAGASGQGRENGTSEGPASGPGAGAGSGPGTQGVGAAGAGTGSGAGLGSGAGATSAAPGASSNSAPPTWVHEIFQGTLTNETRCLCCETVTARDESFLDLSLDIEQNSSVTACLRNFSSTETLSGNDKFFCDKCCSLQEAQKRMRIKALPRVLALHLKRFKYIEQLGRYKKLSYRVVFPLHLRLCNTVDDAPGAEAEYSLFAVIVHMGSGPNHGHYVSLVKSHNHWLFFDDENVETIDESLVQSFFGSSQEFSHNNTDHGYFLFYECLQPELLQRPAAPAPKGS